MPRILLLLSILLLAACRRDDTGSPFARQLAEYTPKVEEALGLKFKTPPKLEVRTKDQVREFLLAHLRDSIPQRELDGQTALFHALGLMHDTLDLKKLFVPLLTEQIIGYYDPRTDVLYVVEGAPKDYAGYTIMHELVHALQDQYIDLDSLERLTHDSDRQSAMQTVIEGQATFEQALMMTGGKGSLTASLPGGWQQIQDLIRQATATQPVFASAPMVIQEALLFPYVNGADFVRRYKERHPGTMPFDSLPQSTEQILHDDKYFGGKPDQPVIVDLPPVSGGFYENNMGEFGIRLFLYHHLKDIKTAAAAASGWAGDRYVVVRTPRGDGVALVAAWDTPMDAAEYVSALTALVGRRLGDTSGVVPASGRNETTMIRRYSARGRTIVIATHDVDGRTVVSYVEVPEGANAAFLDLSKVTLR
ncbi:MAG TPA: hypothetical protein VFO55_08030 [Gemmatimonadaceae bacterium]|nr:hypothetical protein [Gemmatimonadaceae bacterium]